MGNIINQQDHLQIALALHTHVEREAQAARYREKSDDELLSLANALLPAIENRTIFLEGEMLSKDGFAQAVQEQYAITYRGMVVAHQFADELAEMPDQEEEARRFQDDFLPSLRGDYYEEALTARKGWLGMLVSIAENLTHCLSVNDSESFDVLEEAILDYQHRYPRMAAAMQDYLQSWLRANSGN